MSAPDEHVMRARLRKAQLIAGVLERAGGLGTDVALIDETGRRAAEALAGVPVSSDETWSLVADVLSARTALRSRLAELPADPFEVFL